MKSRGHPSAGMHAPPTPPALAVPRGAVPVSWPLCDTVQHPSSSFINLFMGNQKSISLPPDWRDELLEATTDEIEKGWGRLAPRQKHGAALPWIKLLVRGSREDTEEEQCDESRSSSSPRTAGRCAEAATQAGWQHQLPFHAGPLATVSVRSSGLKRAYRLQRLCVCAARNLTHVPSLGLEPPCCWSL